MTMIRCCGYANGCAALLLGHRYSAFVVLAPPRLAPPTQAPKAYRITSASPNPACGPLCPFPLKSTRTLALALRHIFVFSHVCTRPVHHCDALRPLKRPKHPAQRHHPAVRHGSAWTIARETQKHGAAPLSLAPPSLHSLLRPSHALLVDRAHTQQRTTHTASITNFTPNCRVPFCFS